ncbi:hypothetical protein BD413DRAFT_213956 [Trametes elegans]|nr:hypothetical protein BD413DRAFT_213956 [Trametes elegans]
MPMREDASLIPTPHVEGVCVLGKSEPRSCKIVKDALALEHCRLACTTLVTPDIPGPLCPYVSYYNDLTKYEYLRHQPTMGKGGVNTLLSGYTECRTVALRMLSVLGRDSVVDAKLMLRIYAWPLGDPGQFSGVSVEQRPNPITGFMRCAPVVMIQHPLSTDSAAERTSRSRSGPAAMDPQCGPRYCIGE